MTFTKETAIVISQTTDAFPISLEDAWQWLGYSRKDKAKDLLVNNFDLNVDFQVLPVLVECADGKGSSRREDITMTVDCFKAMGMMTRTETGKQIRRYFLEVEKERDQLKQQAPKQLSAWVESRKAVKGTHQHFQNWCLAHGHSARYVHDYVTKLAVGRTAKESRALGTAALINGDPTIGLNYEPSPEQLELIGKIKERIVTYKRGEWKAQVNRAFVEVTTK